MCLKILAKHNWKLPKNLFTNRKAEIAKLKNCHPNQYISWNLQKWQDKQISQNLSGSCSRLFYYQIHFIAEPSSNGQENESNERNLKHVHEEHNDSNDSISDDAYDKDDDNDEDTYDRDDNYDVKDFADEDLIRKQGDLKDEDDYLDEDSEEDEDEADFDNKDNDFDVSEEEKDNLSNENDSQNNPKPCKKKSHLLVLLQNLLDTITVKTTLVWSCLN